MSTEKDNPELVRRIVVTFDICSSTAIIEDLHKTENTVKWRDFLIWIKNYLNSMAQEYDFTMYKFTGDGWILLFDYDFSGPDLFDFLHDFSEQFGVRYKRKIEAFLETPPKLSGVTFGIDRGTLIGFVMNDQTEYVGRAINVACRLQGAIKDKDNSPQYKALITKPLYQSVKSNLSEYEGIEVKRKLRNIADGEDVHCIKVRILS